MTSTACLPSKIDQVACLADRDVIIPEIIVLAYGVRKIVQRTAASSIKIIAATLERAKLRQYAQVPLTDQS